MEYTDAPRSEDPVIAPIAPSEHAEGTASDAVAVILSILPGLGHIYKGHRVMGFLFMMGAPLAAGLAILAATATAGFGLGLGVLYWLGVMAHAYVIKDFVPPVQHDEGEQY